MAWHVVELIEAVIKMCIKKHLEKREKTKHFRLFWRNGNMFHNWTVWMVAQLCKFTQNH